MPRNKIHWYDGRFYDTVIAPHQDKLFGQIKTLLEPGKSVIDIGCGTGRLAFALAANSKSITGIDLSKRNIRQASKTLGRQPEPNVTFLHTSVKELIEKDTHHFDYAIMTYVIHEVAEKERIGLLRDIAQIADRIIIGDYWVPAPGRFDSAFTRLIEFVAGPDHFRNFKNYVRLGGIEYLARGAGLRIEHELRFPEENNHIVLLRS